MGWTLSELFERFGKVSESSESLETEADVLRRTLHILGLKDHAISHLIPREKVDGEVSIPVIYDVFDRRWSIVGEVRDADVIRAAARILDESFTELLERVGVASSSITSQTAKTPRLAHTPSTLSPETISDQCMVDEVESTVATLRKTGQTKPSTRPREAPSITSVSTGHHNEHETYDEAYSMNKRLAPAPIVSMQNTAFSQLTMPNLYLDTSNSLNTILSPSEDELRNEVSGGEIFGKECNWSHPSTATYQPQIDTQSGPSAPTMDLFLESLNGPLEDPSLPPAINDPHMWFNLGQTAEDPFCTRSRNQYSSPVANPTTGISFDREQLVYDKHNRYTGPNLHPEYPSVRQTKSNRRGGRNINGTYRNGNAVINGRIRKSSPPKSSNQNAIRLVRSHAPRSCVSCELNHEKCEFSSGYTVCLRCANRGPRSFTVPCQVFRVKGMELYRFNTTLPEWQEFPFRGEEAGKLKMIRKWNPLARRTVQLTQGRGESITVTLNQFEIPADISDHQRSIFRSQWALHDESFEHTKTAIHNYIRENKTQFVQDGINDKHPLTRCVFQLASRLENAEHISDELRKLLQASMKLWMAARCFGRQWFACWSNAVTTENEDTILVDHQLATIVIACELDPFKCIITQILSNYYTKTSGKTNRPGDVVALFLAKYILLQHIEIIMNEQGRVAMERRSQYRFTNHKLTRDLQEAANNLLSHFHMVCKGTFLELCSSAIENWTDPSASGDLKFIVNCIKEDKDNISIVTDSEDFDKERYFTGQLLESGWTPRSKLDRPIPAVHRLSHV